MTASVAAQIHDTNDWPERLVRIAEVIDAELTLKLVEKYGGVEYFYVPKLKRGLCPTHPWASILGEDTWKKFCRAFGGQRLTIPRGTYLHLKKRIIFELAEDRTLSHRTIALRAQVTETYVRMVLRGVDSAATQLPLFGKQ